MIILNFPGGAGGNWLRKVLLNQELKQGTKNFHYNENKNYQISFKKLHSVDPLDFDYLYSGSYFFNFYVNVIYKHFYLETDKFDNETYNKKFLECVNTARHICKFDTIKHLIFFNFDDLLFAPANFLTQVNYLQKKIQYQETSIDKFLEQKKLFFNTCVSTTELYENFDDSIWVAFVIGQLMNLDIIPTDFVISDYNNKHLCRQFANVNYNKCTLNKVYHFETNVQLPSFLDK
jgi:hypothetical protein